MTLLGYNLVVVYVLSHQEGDLDLCSNILEKQLLKHPNGAWFLFFKGRLEFMRGNFEESKALYIKSWKSQDIWPQFHHLCFWELLWLHCLGCEWRAADQFATFLIEKSRWSTTIYSYQRAALLCMIGDDKEKSSIEALMK
ncbi:tetratricopeptide repeat protein 39B-like [Agrilus planipennis]|uniref:Tetratricopeptide repeat protein 39B-like n=1 Tax=Agrilus planipennis TaxID=224129 RepID=A0A1W4XC77_AGRPL|nr:tetratricopeptide repeat protein 39B-like [Agrilus planipennis]